MFRIGNTHFVSIEDYENRYMEINPRDLISPELREFLSTIPKDQSAQLTEYGQEKYNKEDYLSAVEYYSKALELRKNNLRALYYRALSFIKLEKYESSINDFNLLIELKPDAYEAYFYRANARCAEPTYDRLKGAIIDYTIVINNDCNNGIAYFTRGYCYLMLKQENLAFIDWRKAKIMGVAIENEENWKKDFLD